MARAIWSGALNFGLVTVPVELYSAVGDHSVRFRQFERGTSDRIRYRRVNERTGKEVAYEDIVKDYELGDGEYVIIERKELDEIAPGRSRTIDINAFVDVEEIDPIYFDNAYWLAPTKEEFEKPYGSPSPSRPRRPRSSTCSKPSRAVWRAGGRRSGRPAAATPAASAPPDPPHPPPGMTGTRAARSQRVGAVPRAQAAARSSSSARSRSLRVSSAARSNSARASENRPTFASRSPRTAGSRW